MSSTAQTYFITGGNRGIGFELVRQFAELNDKNIVIATTRSPARSGELVELAKKFTNIHVIDLDVGDEKSIDTIDAQLEKIGIKGIDTFISNAGISTSLVPTLETSSDIYLQHYKVNTLGPILVFQKIYKYLIAKKTRKAIFVSSAAGSITNFLPLHTTAYGQSKVSLNFSVIQLSQELASQNFIVIPIHPGVVATGMSEAAAAHIKKVNPEFYDLVKDSMITPQESAEGLIPVIEGFKEKDTGIFYDYKGEVLTY
ncbi:hypothetical protein DFJ63DRAFT_331909 [Scheffersomyces coipomensis]|uniref:uncharacterized protein n=1 Tax=Scheffersomyces coipomensis TaxID=1788519 RepID=UPI00315D22C4